MIFPFFHCLFNLKTKSLYSIPNQAGYLHRILNETKRNIRFIKLSSSFILIISRRIVPLYFQSCQNMYTGVFLNLNVTLLHVLADKDIITR